VIVIESLSSEQTRNSLIIGSPMRYAIISSAHKELNPELYYIYNHALHWTPTTHPRLGCGPSPIKEVPKVVLVTAKYSAMFHCRYNMGNHRAFVRLCWCVEH